MEEELNAIVALDLGSSRVKIVVGRLIENEIIDILGHGDSACNGLQNGGVNNIEATVNSIRDAIKNAELKSGLNIQEVIVNVSGKSIKAGNHKAVIAITNRDRVVTKDDLNRVVDAIISVFHCPVDQKSLHILTRDFTVDENSKIKDPLGMTGRKLEGEAHIVTASITSLSNLDKCIKNSGIICNERILSSLASAEAVLSASEKDLGTVVVDIGAGITDIVIYKDGGVAFSSVVPLGGINISKDISVGMKTHFEIAEDIKKKHGQASRKGIEPTEKIEIPAINGRSPGLMLRQDLVKIIEARLREIFEYVEREIDNSGYRNNLPGGLILTGGTSLIQGIDELAEEILNLPVTCAKPSSLTGLDYEVSSPEYSTAIGLIRYVSRKVNSFETTEGSDGDQSMKDRIQNIGNFLKNLF
jgi:cell division protein FtsA